MPGMEGTREIEAQTQSPLSLHFLLVPVISQTQPEVGRQRSLADALQRSQPPGCRAGGSWISWDNETNPGKD